MKEGCREMKKAFELSQKDVCRVSCVGLSVVGVSRVLRSEKNETFSRQEGVTGPLSHLSLTPRVQSSST
jgi:glyoxylate carboligase